MKTVPDHGQRRIVACIAIAAFVYQFESNLVNVALPAISVEMRLDMTCVSLIMIVYLLGAAAALVPAGGLGRRFGLKRIFIASIGGMAVGTTICGLSSGLPTLILGRLLQGLCAGGMAALGYVLIPACLPSSLTGFGYGRLSMAAGLGMLAGNPVGGVIAQFMPWRAVFLVSVPIMVALILFSANNLPDDNRGTREKGRRLAVTDSLLVSSGVASAVFCLSFGQEFGFGSAPILASVAVFALLAGLLTARGCRGEIALLPRDVLANRRFITAVGNIILACCVMGGIFFLMPFYFKKFCGLSDSFTSLMMLANAAAYAFIAPFSGSVADKGWSIAIMAGSSLLGGAACVSFSFAAGYHAWGFGLIFLIAFGTATGLFIPAINKTAISGLSGDSKQRAAVFLPMAVIVGSALGVSLFDTIFSSVHPGGEAFPELSGSSSIVITGRVTDGFFYCFIVGACAWLLIMALVLSIQRNGAADQCQD